MQLAIINNSNRHLFHILLISFLGQVLAIYATNQTLLLLHNPFNHSPFCFINDWINCAAAHSSQYASIKGIPVAWLGYLLYFWFFVITIWSVVQKIEIGPLVEVGLTLSLAALIYSLYMAFVSVFILKALCPICMMMYLVNIGLFFFWKKCSINTLLQYVMSMSTMFFKDCNFKKLIVRNREIYLLYTSVFLTFIFGLGLMSLYKEKIIEHHNIVVNIDEEIEKHFRQEKIKLDLNDSLPGWGNPDGKISIVIFSDFQCPFCKIASLQLREALDDFKDYVQVSFINFPLDKNVNPYTPSGTHKISGLAAKASICASLFDSFWLYHDDLFSNQNDLCLDTLLSIASKYQWNQKAFCDCINSQETMRILQRQILAGYNAHITGVPSIYINGKLVNLWFQKEILYAIIKKEKMLLNF